MTVEEFAKSTEEDIKQWCLDNPDVVMARPGKSSLCDCLVAACGRALIGGEVFVLPDELTLMDGRAEWHKHELASLIERFDNWAKMSVTAKEVAEALW